MPRYVIDASVAAKWYFDEEHSAQAARLLADDQCDLVAPDFVRIEVAAVVWKRVIRGEIEPHKAESIVGELLSVPIHLEPAGEYSNIVGQGENEKALGRNGS